MVFEEAPLWATATRSLLQKQFGARLLSFVNREALTGTFDAAPPNRNGRSVGARRDVCKVILTRHQKEAAQVSAENCDTAKRPAVIRVK
jgi:hypothetical protein